MLNNILFIILLFPVMAWSATNTRITHARELMGSRYPSSVVAKAKTEGFEKNLLKAVQKGLPKAFKNKAASITKTIISESEKYQLDPYFLMAVIAGESSFNPLARGPVGEIGLMQIRASTGKWMAEKIKMKWRGKMTLKDPVSNIKLGAAYLAWLREKFEGQSQLYLAAYNMGPKSVKNALGKNIWPKDYPRHVMKRYLAFYRQANVGL